jgi:adenylate kinase
MLRAAVAARTPIGLKAKDIMERGELVPDPVVIAIIADRIKQPDAARGFILDGFPRTVAQAEALERLLAQRGLKLDAVVEIKVDERILVGRIETRIAQMQARGEQVRADDKPEVLKQRLGAYRAQTAPLIDYYGKKGVLRSVDGMPSIDQVSASIGRILTAAPRASSPRRKTAARKAPRKRSKKAVRKSTPKGRKSAAKAGGARRKARKSAKDVRPARKTAARGKARKTKRKQARRAARRG